MHSFASPQRRRTLTSTPVGFPRERIVDAKDAPELCHRVLRVINRGRQNARIRPDGRAYCFFGETRTLSIAIYDRVQAFDMAGAHIMALVLAALAFVFAAGSARPLHKR